MRYVRGLDDVGLMRLPGRTCTDSRNVGVFGALTLLLLMLFGMVMQDSAFKLMVVTNATMPPHLIETRARRAVQIFLRGVRKSG